MFRAKHSGVSNPSLGLSYSVSAVIESLSLLIFIEIMAFYGLIKIELQKFSQVVLVVKNTAANTGDASLILGQGDSLEKGSATRSSILAWRIPWTAKPGGLQSIGSQRVGHI